MGTVARYRVAGSETAGRTMASWDTPRHPLEAVPQVWDARRLRRLSVLTASARLIP